MSIPVIGACVNEDCSSEEFFLVPKKHRDGWTADVVCPECGKRKMVCQEDIDPLDFEEKEDLQYNLEELQEMGYMLTWKDGTEFEVIGE